MTTEPTLLAGISVLWCWHPGWKFPSNHACRATWWINQARNRTAGNTPLMRTASNLYIKMTALGWPSSCNAGVKVTSAELASATKRASLACVMRPLCCELYCHAVCTRKLWNLPHLRFVYERIIQLYPTGFKINHHARSLHMKMLYFAPFTVWTWKKATCLKDYFARWDFKKSPPFRKSAMKLSITHC